MPNKKSPKPAAVNSTQFITQLSDGLPEYLQNLVLMDLDPGTTKLAITLLGPFFSAFSFLFIARIVMSWYPKLPVGKFPYVVAYAPTEPILTVTRKVIPPLGGVDVTPVVWFGLISFLNEILVGPQGLLVLLSQQNTLLVTCNGKFCVNCRDSPLGGEKSAHSLVNKRVGLSIIDRGLDRTEKPEDVRSGPQPVLSLIYGLRSGLSIIDRGLDRTEKPEDVRSGPQPVLSLIYGLRSGPVRFDLEQNRQLCFIGPDRTGDRTAPD
uniref:Protein cofactor assembly of complex C subunit B CCB3, chloroplastic isoform X1 n=1 Tax=Tanacetum cinerariifolium TaxID=118510 RepID=A0A6L2K562_TANCI|nr:protein cofactor assembly of complex C subunit B CCB3, chloroplastic isoform X1 [Tanacetum cinerariifolium]